MSHGIGTVLTNLTSERCGKSEQIGNETDWYQTLAKS